ncbi:hypothetical protein EDC04DRAFT_460318 [Pisolithus marmoratus]|nr:hypothetical protein EDC04DRAFT_460318 [Pisolithus marmoratus]
MNPHDNEMRYWRNLAMQRGHERLNPDCVNNAIRDIYENDLRHNDRGPHQFRRSRTPHPYHVYTLHTPRARTSYGPHGDEPHPHGQTASRAPFPRPVVLPDGEVTPVVPANTTRDRLPRPSSASTSLPLSGIQFHPLLQSPYHRRLPPYEEQAHSSHTPTYHRMTEFDPAHPSRNSHHPSHLSLNEGIRVNREPMVSNHRPQWRTPFAHDTPETWQAPHPSPVPTPELYPFRFPARQLSWTPHPYSDSYATAGWDRNTVFGQSTPQRPAPATVPVQQQSPGPYTATNQSGGRPPWIPGTTPVVSSVPQWSPGTWPLLFPNPVNSNVPQMERGVSKRPVTARPLASARVTLPLDSGRGWSTGAGIDQDPAIPPVFDRIPVRRDVGLTEQLWGPAIIERPVGRVTIRDLLECIYAFFRKHLTHVRKATSSLFCLHSSAADD